jgi:hypothetical protein
MTQWYRIVPTGPVSISNLAPVGQNSGQVACRWPPNGHHLAACLGLSQSSQLLGPFWHRDHSVFVVLPLPVYQLVDSPDTNFYRQEYDEQLRGWEVQPQHRGQEIDVVGGRYLIEAVSFQNLWQRGQVANTGSNLYPLPWQTLTLSHNRRENYEVVDEGGFFAEMTTLLDSEWSLVVGIQGNHQPPTIGTLGAGGTPVVIHSYPYQGDWLTSPCPDSTGAVLLTGALWTNVDQSQRLSVPFPPTPLKGFAADSGQPWQTWKTVRDRSDPQRRVRVLAPGEWLTPAGAVYLWSGQAPVHNSGPYPDPWHRDALGYGHLWLF